MSFAHYYDSPFGYVQYIYIRVAQILAIVALNNTRSKE